MADPLRRLARAVECGRERRDSPWPPELAGEDGAHEITRDLLAAGVEAQRILEEALTEGMRRVGRRFARGEAFIPEILMAARAMRAAMAHLEPHFRSGAASHRGTVVLGTVAGDLHDIGKNIVRMVIEGDGWKVVDLGVDVAPEAFLGAVGRHPGCHLGLSALLTTTMVSMEAVVAAARERFPGTAVFVGGAPVTDAFARSIGAAGTFPDAYAFAAHLAGGGGAGDA